MTDTDTATEQRADDQPVALEASPVHDDANTESWLPVRSRSRKPRRSIVAEAGIVQAVLQQRPQLTPAHLARITGTTLDM